MQADDDNRKLFEEFEEKLRSLANEQSPVRSNVKKDSLKLIKGDNFYLKIYTKPNGKINVKIWKLVERDGKEYRKPLHNPDNLIWKNFESEAVFSPDNIFKERVFSTKRHFCYRKTLSQRHNRRTQLFRRISRLGR